MLIKRFIILSMLLAVLNQTFNTLSTLVAFQMNRQYIAEMLCVNKNRPEMHCNGKCVLMQRMQSDVEKAQNKGQQMLQNLLEHETFLFFENYVSVFTKCKLLPDALLYSINIMDEQNHPQSHLSQIFHPPILS